MPSPNRTWEMISTFGRQSDRWPIDLMPSNMRKYCLYEDFSTLPDATQANLKDQHFDVTPAVNGTGTPTVAFLDRGGIVIGTSAADAGADNDGAVLFPLTSSRWGVKTSNGWRAVADKKLRLETVIRTGASIANYAIIFGLKLTNTEVYKTDDDQVLFVFDTDAVDIDTGLAGMGVDVAAGMTTWYTVCSVGGVDGSANLGVTVAAATDYHLAIEIGTDLKARLYINDVLVYTCETALTTAATFVPYFGVFERVALATKTAGIRYMAGGMTY